uniref:Arp2/3 complex 34 kDa subunit n=1 Tax=Tetraselmis chuii TaxID=63592 RepID=A0A7S1SYM4_9CHLO
MFEWPNFLPVENHLVVTALQRRVGCLDSGAAVDDTIPDAYCEATYHVQCDAERPDRMTLSYTLWPSFDRADTILRASKTIASACQGVAQVRPTPLPGSDLSLEVDLRALSERSDSETLAKRLASLYVFTAGLPLRDMFQRAAEGESVADTAKVVQVSGEQVLYVQEGYGGRDAVAVIFPIRRKGAADDVLCTSFLQEFAAFRQSAALGGSPSCTFSKQTPPELQGTLQSGEEEHFGCFIKFVFNQRHLTPDKLDAAVWSMLSFLPLIAYHIKCCKLAMHTSMRKRVGSMMKVLNRATLESTADDLLQ